MTSNLDYKKYSLDKLKEWIHDALSCGEASPHEIYSVIREAAQEDYQYYKEHAARAFGLLELMSGHRPVADKELLGTILAEREYYERTNKTLSCDKDDPSPECQGAWNDFWQEHYYPEEHKESANLDKEVEEICKQGGYEWTPSVEDQKSKYYYDYNRNDPNRKNPFEKKRWILPVEADPSGEYFVMFPDDLMETANLEEGDTVEWVDQGDGSYLLKKVEKKMTHQEMLDAGYKMTADGFWLPPQDC